jgi:hypothetical protein
VSCAGSLGLSFKLCLRHHRIERQLGIGALFWPDAMAPVNFLNGSLIRHAFFERKRSLGSVQRRLRMKERQSRSNRDQNEANCRYAKEEKDCGAQIKEAGLASGSFALQVDEF